MFHAEMLCKAVLLQPRVEARYPPVQVVSATESWQESPAAAMVQLPRKSVRPSCTSLDAGTAPVVPCAAGSSAASPDAGGAASAPGGGGSGIAVTEGAGAATTGVGCCERGRSRPNGLEMLQPAARSAVRPSAMTA